MRHAKVAFNDVIAEQLKLRQQAHVDDDSSATSGAPLPLHAYRVYHERYAVAVVDIESERIIVTLRTAIIKTKTTRSTNTVKKTAACAGHVNGAADLEPTAIRTSHVARTARARAVTALTTGDGDIDGDDGDDAEYDKLVDALVMDLNAEDEDDADDASASSNNDTDGEENDDAPTLGAAYKLRIDDIANALLYCDDEEDINDAEAEAMRAATGEDLIEQREAKLADRARVHHHKQKRHNNSRGEDDDDEVRLEDVISTNPDFASRPDDAENEAELNRMIFGNIRCDGLADTDTQPSTIPQTQSQPDPYNAGAGGGDSVCASDNIMQLTDSAKNVAKSKWFESVTLSCDALSRRTTSMATQQIGTAGNMTLVPF